MIVLHEVTNTTTEITSCSFSNDEEPGHCSGGNCIQISENKEITEFEEKKSYYTDLFAYTDFERHRR